MKLWGGRFTKATDKSVEEFNASIQFDCRMYAEDICGSIAHATMLAKQGIISQEDKDAIVKGLKAIFQQIEDGNFDFSVELEDIHMNIEKRLTDAIGEAGKRLHTGRSRNDQVALDTHMYVRREIAAVAKLLVKLQESLVKAAKYSDVIMPGYTHLQRAQPILFSHHLMAYFSMLSRDFIHLKYAWDMADIMPSVPVPWLARRIPSTSLSSPRPCISARFTTTVSMPSATGTTSSPSWNSQPS